MKALISPNENNRIVEVKANNKIFPIAEPLYWIDCPVNCTTLWKYENETFIQPAPPLPPQPVVIDKVSMRQARLALLQEGLLTNVNLAIQQGSEADKITWEYATEVNKNDALVQNMVIALGLSQDELDNLFNLASTL